MIAAAKRQRRITRDGLHPPACSFYAAVEAAIRPELAGVPLGVVQYNPFGDLSSHSAEEDRLQPESNGSLIAVSYEARAFGVKRCVRRHPCSVLGFYSGYAEILLSPMQYKAGGATASICQTCPRDETDRL